MPDTAATNASRPEGEPRDRSAVAARLAEIGVGTVQGFFADRCPQQAAAISYRVLFSLAPLAIVLVSIFGLVLQDDEIRRGAVNAAVDALPLSGQGEQDLEAAAEAVAAPATAAGLISLALFAWAAAAMMASIRQGLECAMRVDESRPLARGKLVDLALVVGAAALVLVTFGIAVVNDLVLSGIETVEDVGALGDALSRGASFAVSVVVVLLLYRFVPARGLGIRDGLIGALATAGLLQLISLGSDWIHEKTTKFTILYGSLTGALLILYSVYLCSCALLVGAELASACSRPAAANAEPLRARLRRTGKGLLIRQKPSPAAIGVPDLIDDAAPDL